MLPYLFALFLALFSLETSAYSQIDFQYSIAGKKQLCTAANHEIQIRPYQAGKSQNIEFFCRDKKDPNNFIQILAEKLTGEKNFSLKLIKAEYSLAKKNKIPEVSGGFAPQKASGFFKISPQKNSKNIKGEFTLLLAPEHANNPKNQSRLKITGKFSYAAD